MVKIETLIVLAKILKIKKYYFCIIFSQYSWNLGKERIGRILFKCMNKMAITLWFSLTFFINWEILFDNILIFISDYLCYSILQIFYKCQNFFWFKVLINVMKMLSFLIITFLSKVMTKHKKWYIKFSSNFQFFIFISSEISLNSLAFTLTKFYLNL